MTFKTKLSPAHVREGCAKAAELSASPTPAEERLTAGSGRDVVAGFAVCSCPLAAKPCAHGGHAANVPRGSGAAISAFGEQGEILQTPESQKQLTHLVVIIKEKIRRAQTYGSFKLYKNAVPIRQRV